MTIEQSWTISPSDIASAVFECSQCGAQTTLQLGGIQHTPILCSNCGIEWLSMGTSEHELLTRLLGDLANLEAILRNRRFLLKFKLSAREWDARGPASS